MCIYFDFNVLLIAFHNITSFATNDSFGQGIVTYGISCTWS